MFGNVTADLLVMSLAAGLGGMAYFHWSGRRLDRKYGKR